MRPSGSLASRRRCRSVSTASCTPALISIARLVELLSVNPARILRLPGGSLSEGAPADLTILAPDLPGHRLGGAHAIEIKEHALRRLGLRGGVAATIVGGRTVYVNEDANFRGLGLRHTEPA